MGRLRTNVAGGSSALPTINSSTGVSATAGTPFSYQITATNNPTTYSALGLPVGLLFDAASGIISGTPPTSGVFSVPIYATNDSGSSASEVTITISPTGAPVLGSNLTAAATGGSPFSYQIQSTGLVDIYGATGLPSGLSLNPTSGVISGTTNSSGTFPISLSASNQTGSATATLSLTVTGTQVSFDTWAAQYPSLVGGATGTPEHDGVPNLLKYLFHIDPTRPMTVGDQAALPAARTACAAPLEALRT